jgi:hypothetical protein
MLHNLIIVGLTALVNFVFYYYSFLSTKAQKRNMIVLVATSIGHLDLVAATHIDSLSIFISPLTAS